jgi:alkanesulfonate monooxygenase SsuD/methylene tetrahydromethanopterin reductase-like flavin-dependent oxidoreductase (luciferase family)
MPVCSAAPGPNAMTRLKVGVVLPSLATQRRDGIDLRIAARHAENDGLDSVWHGDHLATGQPSLDLAVGLATVAAVTERISIGAGVFIPAIRPLAWAAKQIASVQHVSGGRLILGVGSGGGPEQWAAAEVPYAERGARTDLALGLLPALLAGEPVFIGDQAVVLAPAVTRPPFWVGNASSIAIRRAARVGDGWFPSLIPASAVAIGAARLAELTDTPREIAVGTTGALGDGLLSQEKIAAKLGASHGRQLYEVPITGGPHEAASRFVEFQNAGATHLVMGFADGDWRNQCDLLAEAVRLMR